jgi:hypothetical protein
LGALLSFRGASVQSELDAFLATLWALNDRLIDTIERQGKVCTTPAVARVDAYLFT